MGLCFSKCTSPCFRAESGYISSHVFKHGFPDADWEALQNQILVNCMLWLPKDLGKMIVRYVGPTYLEVLHEGIVKRYVGGTWVNLSPPHKELESDPMNTRFITWLQNQVYVVGSSTHLNLVRRYDFETRLWSLLAPMSIARHDHAVTVLNGQLYVVGGLAKIHLRGSLFVPCQHQSYMCTAERYDPSQDQWVNIASMSTGRKNHALTVLNGKLYATGGTDELGNILCSVECYDPVSNQWTFVSPLNTKRSCHAAGVLNGKLYVLGGFERSGFDTWLTTVERYDDVKDHWTVVCSMNQCCTYPDVLANYDQLYVLGQNPFNQTYTIECYQEAEDRWKMVPQMDLR